MSKNVFIFCETEDKKLSKTSFEISTVGKKITQESGGKIIAVVINCDADQINMLSEFGVSKVYNINNDKLKEYSTEGFSSAVKEIVDIEKPEIILLSATPLGKDLAPRLAAKLDTELMSDVIDLNMENDTLISKRALFAGKAIASIKSNNTPLFASIRMNIFKPEKLKSGEFEIIDYSLSGELNIKTAVKDIIREAGEKLDVAEADIIVSGGRAMKGPENFKMLEQLAELFGAAVGASRAAVDADWIEHSHQVGQTGKVVNPALYIACGISGAIQHLAGMRTSKYIVAINKDPEAPIFKVADYGVVGDIFEVVPAIIEELKK